MVNLQHYEEGSPACCAVLRAMHRHPDGLSMASISSLTGLDPYTVRDAMAGLKARQRACDRMLGTLRLWHTAHHFRQIAT